MEAARSLALPKNARQVVLPYHNAQIAELGSAWKL